MNWFCVVLALLLASGPAAAQIMLPESHSQRTYITFGDAAKKIISAAYKRASPGSTANIEEDEAYRRIVEYAKHSSSKLNENIGGDGFSYMSFAPYQAGKLNGELASYTFASGLIMLGADREAGAFSYRMRKDYQTPFYFGPRGFPLRIYEPDLAFAYKTMPRLLNGVISYTNLCTSSAASCSVLSSFPPGQFRWFYRDSSQPWAVACNEVSDCVQASISMNFYNSTYKYRTQGYDNLSNYFGEYKATPSGSCNDTSEYAFLSYGMIGGLACIFSQRWNQTSNGSAGGATFNVVGDVETGYLRYISLLPVPFVCPGVLNYPAILACDPRFADDVLSVSSIQKLVDRMYFWAASRQNYSGYKYTPITKQDVENVLGVQLVKVSSLALPLETPKAEAPSPPASAPGTPASGAAGGFGDDPGTPPPTLQQITALDVLSPVLDVFPSFRSYGVPGYSVLCPAFSLTVFGSTHLIDAHCHVAEGQRLALGIVCLFGWAVTAMAIVLRA